MAAPHKQIVIVLFAFSFIFTFCVSCGINASIEELTLENMSEHTLYAETEKKENGIAFNFTILHAYLEESDYWKVSQNSLVITGVDSLF